MNANRCIGGMVTALALFASTSAIAQKPLRIDLVPILQQQAHVAKAPPHATPAQRIASRRSFAAPQPNVLERDLRLTDRREARQEALSTLGVGLLTSLDPADTTSANSPANGYPELRFQKQGHLARDIQRGYRNMGENLARRVFDEPRGKRIVFDVAGKPGVGLAIPLGKKR